MVIRIPPGLDETLTDLAGKLFDETERNHPLAAVVRGLIAIGLAAVADAPKIAPLFVGVLIARGRRKSPRRSS
jgi:fructose-specific phosphotransferase system IIC component